MGGATYYTNLCGISYWSTLPTNESCAKKSSVCRMLNGELKSFGLLRTQKITESLLQGAKKDQGVTVTYVGGDKCTDSEMFESIIHVICSESADPGFYYKVDETDCVVSLYMYSSSGCPTVTKVSAVSGAGIFLIM